MSNLLSIETAFLNLPQVKAQLNLTDIKRIQRSIKNAQKSKFGHTMKMSKLVNEAVTFFESTEGKELFAEEVFGWQKSFFYKVIKAGKLDQRIVDAFNEMCDANGEDAQRSIAGLLEFSRDIDLDSLEHSEDATEEQIAEAEQEAITEAVENTTERVETIITLSFKNPNGDNVAWRIDANGEVFTRNTQAQVQEVLAMINGQLS
jgi:hypothetical protein